MSTTPATKTEEDITEKKFLEHVYKEDYHSRNVSLDFIGPLVRDALKKYNLKGNLIDVGCGNGAILKFLRTHFFTHFQYSGIDLFENHDRNENPIHFFKRDLNTDFSEGLDAYDVVLTCEVIEHVIDTDHFITKVKNLLKPGGTLLITTPNLASFFNRILLLFGYQPLHTEVSWQNPYLGREKLYDLAHQTKAPAAGHLRVFTHSALVAFLKFHGFQVEESIGFAMYDGLLGRVSRLWRWFPSMMPGIFIVAKKS